MIAGRLLPWMLLALALACGACAVMYHLWDAADERADLAEGRLLKQAVIAKVVKEYVHDIVYKPVPDSVIRDRVDRLCEQRLRSHRPDADGTAAADADHRFDRDLVAAWRNGRQLAAVQEAARAAGCAQ